MGVILHVGGGEIEKVQREGRWKWKRATGERQGERGGVKMEVATIQGRSLSLSLASTVHISFLLLLLLFLTF